jgi:DNA-binding response OmpR family regulator
MHADPDRLNQALTNLLSNAVKFSPPQGTVVVELSCTTKGVRISVADRGPGIPEEFQKRIFERFAQADSSDTRQTGGSGLGLSIAREIVVRHGGTLSYDTVAGQGTTFHLDIPEASLARHEPLLSALAEPEMIAVCSQNPIHAQSICAALKSSGFGCKIHQSEEQALRDLAQSRPRAVVVDFPFGNTDPSQLVPALRDRSESPILPVIFVSLEEPAAEVPKVAHAFPIVDWITDAAGLHALPERIRTLALRASPDRRRVLHVEDDRDVLEVVRRALEGEFHVVAAPTLEMARTRLAQEDFDIVILDLTLGDGLGRDLIPALVDAAGEPIPTVIFSAQDATPELAPSVEAILTKSRANLETLVEAVRLVSGRSADQVTRKGAVL